MNSLSIIASFLSSIMLAGMSVFVIYKDWRDQVNRYYFFYNLSALGILITMFFTYAYPDRFNLVQVNSLTQVSTILFFSSLFSMSLVFPKGEKKFPFKISILVLLPAFAIGGVIAVTNLTITDAYFKDGLLQREFTKYYDIYIVIAFLYLTAGLFNFIRKYIVAKVEIYRLQMRYVFIGTSIAIFLAAVSSIIIPRFFQYFTLYVIGPSIATFVATLSLFYSVIAHNLMDIRTAIHKTAMYAVISGIILIPIYFIIDLYMNRAPFIGEAPSYIIAGSIIVVFVLFTVYIQPVVDRLFRRKQYEFENIIDNYIRDVKEVQDTEVIIKRTVDILFESMYLKRAFFIMLNEKTRKYEMTYWRSDEEFELEPIERSSSLVRWFVRNQEILSMGRVYIDDKSFLDIRDEILQFYTSGNVSVVLPMYHDKILIGFLCLGEKETFAGYTPAELDKLIYFQRRSNDLISSSIIYEKAVKDQFIARTIDLSSEILSRSVPDTLPNVKEIKFSVFLIPKYAEGSDYFDFIRPGSEGIGCIATDISGVGVNSSLYSVILRSSFHSSVHEAPLSSTVMENINNALFSYTGGKGGMVTAFYFYFDFKSHRLIYTNAGYPSMELFRVEKNSFDTLDTEGIPLGHAADASFGTGRTNLVRGDIGILYSRTIITSKNRKGEQYGLTGLRSAVSEKRTRPAHEIAEGIRKSFEAFMGLSSPDSDVIAIVFKVA